MLKFYHYNYNVADLDRAMQFYKVALGLEPVRRIDAEDGSVIKVFLGDGVTDFTLQLTWRQDHPQAYDLGENQVHLAIHTDELAAFRERHSKMGCICREEPNSDIYFICDPDGFWTEIVPVR